jgi:DNA-binding NarL/FixJ family response regulator
VSEDKIVSILIVEDNELTRLAIRAVLEQMAGFKILDEAVDGESAVAKAEILKPNVVLADIGLPGMSGIEATKQIKRSCPDVRVLMLTSHENDEDIFQAFDAGADGYVFKDTFSSKLELAIRSVNEGITWLDPRIAMCILKAAPSHRIAQSVSPNQADHPEPLSEHETAMLQLVAEDEPQCKDGVCQIDPDFLQRLHRFARKREIEAS